MTLIDNIYFKDSELLINGLFELTHFYYLKVRPIML